MQLNEPERALAALELLLSPEREASELEVSAHVLAAQILLDSVEVPDPARVVSLLKGLEQRARSLTDPRARMWLGIAHAQLGQYVEALQLLDDKLDEQLATRVAPGHRAAALYCRGLALFETGQPAAAEQILRSAVRLLQEAEQPSRRAVATRFA